MKKYVVLWWAGPSTEWHVEDTFWPTRKHAEMAAELFSVKKRGFTVSISEVTIPIPQDEARPHDSDSH